MESQVITSTRISWPNGVTGYHKYTHILAERSHRLSQVHAYPGRIESQVITSRAYPGRTESQVITSTAYPGQTESQVQHFLAKRSHKLSQVHASPGQTKSQVITRTRISWPNEVTSYPTCTHILAK